MLPQHQMKAKRSIILTLLALLVVSTFACGSEEETPTPMPTAPLVEEWSPDGMIKVREYYDASPYGDYEIHWRSDEQYIYIGIRAKTNGWLAIAFQPGLRMKDADMVLGFVEDGEAIVYDLFSTGDFGPHLPDTELGGNDDIIEFGGKEQGGYTIIEFKRALDTGDDYDNPLSEGVNKVIWAYGSQDELALKHIDRGYGEMNLQ